MFLSAEATTDCFRRAGRRWNLRVHAIGAAHRHRSITHGSPERKHTDLSGVHRALGRTWKCNGPGGRSVRFIPRLVLAADPHGSVIAIPTKNGDAITEMVGSAFPRSCYKNRPFRCIQWDIAGARQHASEPGYTAKRPASKTVSRSSPPMANKR